MYITVKYGCNTDPVTASPEKVALILCECPPPDPEPPVLPPGFVTEGCPG